jgi:hypothetical protein
MEPLQSGPPIKLKRTDNGKVSSLSDLEGAELADRILATSEEDLAAESVASVQLMMKKIVIINTKLDQNKVNALVVKFFLVTDAHEELENDFVSFIDDIEKPDFLSQEINNLINQTFLAKNRFYKLLLDYAPGLNLGHFYRSIESKDDELVVKFLNSNLDLSFISSRIGYILIAAGSNLEVSTFRLLFDKLNPGLEVIPRLMRSNKFSVALKITEEILKRNQITNGQAKIFFDQAVQTEKPQWMAYWGLRGVKLNEDCTKPLIIEPYLEPSDENLKAFFENIIMTSRYFKGLNKCSDLTSINHGSLRKYRHLNYELFIFLLSRSVCLNWGFSSDIKNPFNDYDYNGGFQEAITKLYWIETLQKYSKKYPWLEKIVKALQDIRNSKEMKSAELDRTLQEINSASGEPILFVVGGYDHLALELFIKNKIAFCNRGYSNDNSTTGVNSYYKKVILKADLENIADSRRLNSNLMFGEKEQAKILKLTPLTKIYMSKQSADNCSVASLDAAVLAMMVELNEKDDFDVIKNIYKELTLDLRETALRGLMFEVQEYLSEPRTRALDQFFYTLLAGVYLKIKNSAKKQGQFKKYFDGICFLMAKF